MRVRVTSDLEDVHVGELELECARKEAESRPRPVEVAPDARAASVLPALRELHHRLITNRNTFDWLIIQYR